MMKARTVGTATSTALALSALAPSERPVSLPWVRAVIKLKNYIFVSNCVAVSFPCFVRRLPAEPSFSFDDDLTQFRARAPFDEENSHFAEALVQLRIWAFDLKNIVEASFLPARSKHAESFGEVGWSCSHHER